MNLFEMFVCLSIVSFGCAENDVTSKKWAGSQIALM